MRTFKFISYLIYALSSSQWQRDERERGLGFGFQFGRQATGGKGFH